MRVPATQSKEISMERFKRLAHSIWDCKYHIVWIPKYRRKELYGTKRLMLMLPIVTICCKRLANIMVTQATMKLMILSI